MERESFVFRKEWLDAMGDLPAKVRAEVYVAIIEYGITGEAPELKSMGRIAFNFIRKDMDRDFSEQERRADESERMRQLAMKRWKKDADDATAYASADTSADTSAYASADTSEKPTDTSLIIKYNKENINNKEDISIKDNIKKERESRKRKKEPKPPKKQVSLSAIEARKEDFYNSLVPFVTTYGRDMIRSFFDYWSEYNRSQTKMRYELERTWQTSRRLATWASRDNNFKSRNNGTDRTTNQEQVRQRADDALAIMQELRAESGSTGQL